MISWETLSLALGASFASGINLYATCATLGLLHRFEVIRLPSGIDALANPIVLAVAVFLYVVEFGADKIPYLDNVWDVIHTFVRPGAAAVLAFAAVGDVPEVWRWSAGLLAGTVALTSHGAKATTRAAVNASPEPFSNIMLSLAEDGLAIFVAWMAATHPYLTVVLVAVLLVLCVVLLVTLTRFLRAAFRRLFGRKTAEPVASRAAPV